MAGETLQPELPWYRDLALRRLLALTVLLRLAVVQWGLHPPIVGDWSRLVWRVVVYDLRGWLFFLGDIQRHGKWPYVDFSREYPAGIGLLYWLWSPLIPLRSLDTLMIANATLMGAFDVDNTFLLYRLLRAVAPERAGRLTLWYLLLPTGVLLSPFRYEPVVTTAVLAGCLAWRRGHWAWAAGWWGWGFNLKWYPLAFLGAAEYPVLWHAWRRGAGPRWRWLRAGLVALAITAAVNGPFLAAGWLRHGHVEQWSATYTRQATRDTYPDSPAGIAGRWLGHQATVDRVATGLTLALLAAAALLRPRMRVEAKSALLCLAFLAASRAYSPQFHLWFLPWVVLLAAADRDRAGPLLAWTTALEWCNLAVFPLCYAWALAAFPSLAAADFCTAAGAAGWGLTLAVALRLAALVGLATCLWRYPDQPPPQGPVPPAE